MNFSYYLPALARCRALSRWSLALAGSALACACGGGGAVNGGTSGAVTTGPAELSSVTMVVDVPTTILPAAAAQELAVPAFHAAPVILAPPDDIDSIDNAASAHRAPRVSPVPPSLRGLPTGQLTLDAIEGALRDGGAGVTSPALASSTTITYSPAQIRAAYAFPALPPSGSSPTAAQAAQMGAGQTIYIIDGYDDPNAAAELAIFDQTFGLPPCTNLNLGPGAALPLAAPPTASCQFSTVYATPNGTMASLAPAYNANWAMEIALDVQWAHATAPLARIVLIEAPDATLGSLMGAINLANAMGPGVVSMSFGGAEGSWTSTVDAAFSAANMTYLAATGDSGAGVEWPAVSAQVLAVGGTSLTYSGSGMRAETAWSGAGGGVSQYVPVPSYQSSTVPGMGAQSWRNIADVSFNADPGTGQYLAIMSPGSAAINWLSVGGTSLATPQWAGLIAVANAERAQSHQAALGAPHAALYGQVATSPGTYASDLVDVTQGSDGSCATCAAKVGYDAPTGIGTPNALPLLASLTGNSLAASAPLVGSAQVHGSVGTALSFTVSASAPNPLSFSLNGAPSGMTIAASGVVTWPVPLAGSYAVTVKATDTKTNLSGQGVYTVVIAGPAAPVVTAAVVSAPVGYPFSYPVVVAAPHPVSFTLSGAPTGMSISAAGVLSWPTPATGSYSVTVTARDGTTGLTGQGVITVSISTPTPPQVSAGTIHGYSGNALSFPISVKASDPVRFALGGAPAGMTVSTGGVVSWPAPVAGSYSVKAVATDTKTGLLGTGIYTVVIATSGPSITAAPIRGVAGKPLSGTISFADPSAAILTVHISGVPLGMSFVSSGASLIAQWPKPVAGSYTLAIQAVDYRGLSASANVPVTVTSN